MERRPTSEKTAFVLFVLLEIKIIPKVPLVNKEILLLTSDFPLSPPTRASKQKAHTALPALPMSALADLKNKLNLMYKLKQKTHINLCIRLAASRSGHMEAITKTFGYMGAPQVLFQAQQKRSQNILSTFSLTGDFGEAHIP